MTTRDQDRPWPHWLLRHMVIDDEDSFESLVWSVGGSPPYGGIPWDEASAIYHLLESFHGEGTASEEKYAIAREQLMQHADRAQVLELFRAYDEIVSNSETYAMSAADAGLKLARQVGDPGAIGLFKLYRAGAMSRIGDHRAAAAATVDALDDLLAATEADPSCEKRLAQAAQNAVVMTSLGGDTQRAAGLLADLSDVLPPPVVTQLQTWLAAQ